MPRKSTKITPVISSSHEEAGEDKEVKLSLEDLIPVMSLCATHLVLTRDEKGTRPYWEFDKFGDVQQIQYSYLLEIMNAHRTFLESGIYYIMDKRVIKRHGLQPIYDKLLTKEKIEKMLSGSQVDSAIELYKNASNHQKNSIETMLLDKIRNGQFNDLGSISKFSKAAGKDFNKIVERQKELRELWKADNLQVEE